MPEKLLKDVLFEKVENSYSLKSDILNIFNEAEFKVTIDSDNMVMPEINNGKQLYNQIIEKVTDFVNQNYTLKSNG